MATLTALRFDTADGAENALATVETLAIQEIIDLLDAAYVDWLPGKKKPKTHQLDSMTGAGTAIGAGFGALFGKMADVGIDDDFIKSVRSEVTKGTSALFLLTGEATEDKVVDAMKQYDFEIISTNLSKEEEERLREAFAHEDDD